MNEAMRVDSDSQVLLDEIEQLRTALETAEETLHHAIADRDRLGSTLVEQARELQGLHESRKIETARGKTEADDLEETVDHGADEEELRIAFEELQVLSEELEVANQSLMAANRELDSRVGERTRALEASEASFKALADLVPDLLWRCDRAGRRTWENERWRTYTGRELSESAVASWTEVVHPADRATALAGWRVAVARGEDYESEHRMRHADGVYRWFLVRAEPLRDPRGEVTAWFGASTDVHDQRTALQSLQAAEQRLRTLVEGVPQLVWRARSGGQWSWASPQWRDFTGQSGEQAYGRGWLRAIHPDDRGRALTAWDNAETNGVLDVELRIYAVAEGHHRHFQSRASPVRSEEGRILEWLGTCTDVHDLLALQDQQQVLVTELHHRTRNLIAVIRSVADQTLRASPDLNTFRPAFWDRLSALSRVQGLLSKLGPEERVTFPDLLRAELEAHGALKDGAAVMLDGPEETPLRSSAVQMLAMALHELATNAVKYGALGQPAATLEIRWEVEPDDPGLRLQVDWHERGVCMPDAGERQARGNGQGRELIERALPYQLNAITTYTFQDDGLHCTLSLPVLKVAAERRPSAVESAFAAGG